MSSESQKPLTADELDLLIKWRGLDRDGKEWVKISFLTAIEVMKKNQKPALYLVRR